MNSLTISGTDATVLTVTVGVNTAVITANPFRIDFLNDNVMVVSMNAIGLMRFEHLRLKTTA